LVLLAVVLSAVPLELVAVVLAVVVLAVLGVPYHLLFFLRALLLKSA
jgi:hypothetical protein